MNKTLIKKNSFLQHIFSGILHNKVVSLIIICGGITNLGVIFFSGSYLCIKNICGIYIGGLHFHDSLWHLALANSAFYKIPFQLPIYAGASLQGYNYFIDLIIFALSQLGIPAVIGYFKFIPVLFFILFSCLSYIYAKKINKSYIYILCFLFFDYFGSSFTYILSLYHFKTFSSFFYSQAMQSGRMLLNLPYAVSLLPFLGVLIVLKNRKLNLSHIFLLGFLLFLTMGFKLYGGVILFFLISTDFFIQLLIEKEKKYTHWVVNMIIIVLWFACSIVIFYNPFASIKSGAIFTFSPFALTRPMIEAADHFYMPQLVQARYYLQAINPLSPRLLAIELLGVVLFIFLNVGTRIVGFIYMFQSIFKKKFEKDEIVLISTILFSSILTFTLVQKGTWWNVVQFYGYTLFLMNYFASKFLYKLFVSKRTIFIFFGILIILLTLPTNIEQIKFAFERKITISNIELDALEKLKYLPTGVVLSLPVQDTAYVTAFSGKQQYIADEGQLTSIGLDARARINAVKNTNIYDIVPKISYIYINKEQFMSPYGIKGFYTIFENSKILIKARK